MLQKIIIKKIVEIIMKQFKLDKILKYVEEPNELDKKIKSMNRTLNKYGKYIESMEKDIAVVKSIVNKPIDGVTTRLNKLEKITNKFK